MKSAAQVMNSTLSLSSSAPTSSGKGRSHPRSGTWYRPAFQTPFESMSLALIGGFSYLGISFHLISPIMCNNFCRTSTSTSGDGIRSYDVQSLSKSNSRDLIFEEVFHAISRRAVCAHDEKQPLKVFRGYKRPGKTMFALVPARTVRSNQSRFFEVITDPLVRTHKGLTPLLHHEEPQ